MFQISMPPKFMLMLSMPLVLNVSACTGFSTSFDCPTKPGVNCKSVSEVNALVDGGLLPQKFSENAKNISLKEPSCTTPGCCEQSKPEPGASSTSLSIWVAPFVDNTGIVQSDHYLSVPSSVVSEPLPAFSEPTLGAPL